MRIEPPSKSHPRQLSNRRQRVDSLSAVNTEANGNIASKNPSPLNKNVNDSSQNKDVVPVVLQKTHTVNAKVSRRWRSHVPFIAQYIGQQTATETAHRSSRRNPEIAKKAYDIRISATKLPTSAKRFYA